MADAVLKNVRLWGKGAAVDLKIENGKIAAITAHISSSESAQAQTGPEDFGGRALLPGFAEPHVHLDKTLSISEGVNNKSSTLDEAIALWNALAVTQTQVDFEARNEAALRLAISRGVTHLRSHINVFSDNRKPILAALAVRERFKDKINLQFSALGHCGTPIEDAAYGEAIELGVDVIGGSPNHTPDPKMTIHSAFALAEKYRRPIDLHIDESENPQDRYVELVAEYTKAHGMAGWVSVDHICALSYRPIDEQQRVAELLANAGVNVISLPAVNLILQGHETNPARGLAPIRRLLDAGVNVCIGTDNVRDPFNPTGNYDPLWQANLTVHVAHLTRVHERTIAIDLITSRAAKAMNLPDYGLEVGCAADLVLLDSTDDQDLLCEIPARLRVWKAGKLVFKQEVSRTWL